MVKPTKEDAHLLLRLHELSATERAEKAMDWFWAEFQPKKIRDSAEFKKAYPTGSEGARNFRLISTFCEMAGVLVNNGLLHEGLFFDRYLVAPLWEAFQQVIYAERKEYQEPRLAENFELLYEREKAWDAKHPPKIKK
jgi:hypothetical protein